jgi:hypothetical protein
VAQSNWPDDVDNHELDARSNRPRASGGRRGRTGRISEFSGEYKEGAMRFEGESHLSDRRRVLRRMTLFNLDGEHVRQFSRVSFDDGKTWSVNDDFTYTRKPQPANR